MRQEQFLYHGFVLNKHQLSPRTFRKKQVFYDNVVGWICENARPLLYEAKVVIDECGDREFRRRLAAALKGKMNEPGEVQRIRKVQMEASHNNNLLQLADMICGAVARDYSCRNQTFRKLIEPRERRIQFWPK